jgi:hypothetical protein
MASALCTGMPRLLFVTLLALLAACAPAETDEPADESNDALGATDPRRVDPAFALLEARLAAAAYGDWMSTRSTLRALGIEQRPTLFVNEVTSTFAFHVSIGSYEIVAFEGTDKSGDDIATDIDAAMLPTPLGRVHAGFYTAFRSVWDDDAPGLLSTNVLGQVSGRGLASFLAERHPLTSEADPRPLVFVGHSLGGALASLAYAFARFGACEKNGYHTGADIAGCAMTAMDRGAPIAVHSLVTFGAPRVGDFVFADLLAFGHPTAPIFRFVHGNDIMPTVPRRGVDAARIPFRHPASAQLGENVGLVALHDDGGIETGDRARAPSWPSVADHLIAAYIAALEKAVERDRR